MARKSGTVLPSRQILFSDLDYYVESFQVHTCERLEAVMTLLWWAELTPLDLLIAWAEMDRKGPDNA
jgi:hypothetical protein